MPVTFNEHLGREKGIFAGARPIPFPAHFNAASRFPSSSVQIRSRHDRLPGERSPNCF
jgi:hypothetical protein